MSTYDQLLEEHFGRAAHATMDCKGTFKHLVQEETSGAPGRVGSYASCEVCKLAYHTPGFEHWLETYRAYKLLDKEGILTTEELRFLRLHFQVLGDLHAR